MKEQERKAALLSELRELREKQERARKMETMKEEEKQRQLKIMEQERFIQIKDLIYLNEDSEIMTAGEIASLKGQLHELAIKYELSGKQRTKSNESRMWQA